MWPCKRRKRRDLVNRRQALKLAGYLLAVLPFAIAAEKDSSGSGRSTPFVGGYWEYYGPIPLSQVPAGYNLVYVAFAKGQDTTSGTLVLPPLASESHGQFKLDVAALRARGTTVLLSIGGDADVVGGNSGYTLDTPSQQAQAIASLEPIISAYGFDGIDWDLEHAVYPDAVVAVTRALRSTYPDLAVSMAPTWLHVPVYQAIASGLGEQLTLFGPQFYDMGVSQTQYLGYISDTVDECASLYGAQRVMIGTMQAGTATETTAISTCLTAWKAAVAKHRSLGGMYVWDIDQDVQGGSHFVNEVGSLITGGK